MSAKRNPAPVATDSRARNSEVISNCLPSKSAELGQGAFLPSEEGGVTLNDDDLAPSLSMTIVEAALLYASQGFTVFPATIDKKSYKSKKYSGGANWGATRDAAQIRRDFSRWADANVGLPTGSDSGIFVVEADTIEGHTVDGIASLDALQARHGAFPATRVARSPSGSMHYYFRWPDNIAITNSTSLIAPGVDVRGEGGMVIAPPSVKPGKGKYEWLNWESVAEAPAWLIELCKKSGTKRKIGGAQTTSPPEAIVARAVTVLPNEDLGWEEWNKVAMAIFAATGGSEDGFDLFSQWSQKSRKYDAAATRERWDKLHSSPPDQLTVGTLLWMADQADPGWRAPLWREKRPTGRPAATMHNARVAITALGIECRKNTFHNKILLGPKGDEFKHEILPHELTDDAIIRLRQIISDRYGFDPEDKSTWDAVKSLALEHCFNPILDMLAEAEVAWDGIARLDTMAVEYFNAEDTPFSRAAVRKLMIAAVRRVRQPGCKYDTIVVLESPEGWDKSKAFRALAGGDENFSDQRVMGAGEKETQEQLAGVWIHESAELSGMRKAEVEQVKAFASRQYDRARAAYARAVSNQPRQCINVGTTNSDKYLHSQTGNRRFLPIKVTRRIDVEKLRHDRLQLFGEAAKYETNGEPLTLDESLWDAAAEEQEKRRVRDAWEDILAIIPAEIDFFDLEAKITRRAQIIHCLGDCDFVTSVDLLTHVLRIAPGQQAPAISMRLSTVMQKLGWKHARKSVCGDRPWGYSRPRVERREPPQHTLTDDMPM